MMNVSPYMDDRSVAHICSHLGASIGLAYSRGLNYKSAKGSDGLPPLAIQSSLAMHMSIIGGPYALICSHINTLAIM